jgi:hypothetical protein
MCAVVPDGMAARVGNLLQGTGEVVLGVNRRGKPSGTLARPGARCAGDRVRLLVHVQALAYLSPVQYRTQQLKRLA